MDKEKILSVLREVGQGKDIYLVGGTVRDMVIGRVPVDIDIAVSSDAEGFAESLSRKVRGAVFPLDKERGIFRIVTKDNAPPVYYDVSPLKGADIYEDIAFRDFTVDAMALSLSGDARVIIDPHNGRIDIRDRRIRVISRKSFEDDPLRLLRAFRLAGILGFEIDRETLQFIQEMSPSLRVTASERTRDELFRLLSIKNSVRYLKQMHEAGLLKEVLTGLGKRDIKKGLKLLEGLEHLYSEIEELFSPHYSDIHKYLEGRIENEITNASMWKWMSLYDIGHRDEKLMRSALKGLKIGNKGCRLVILAVKHFYNDILDFLKKGLEDKRAVYELFKTSGDDGIGGILYQIASVRSSGKSTDAMLRNGNDAISWYLREYKPMKLTPLITGKDLIELFDLPPGPVFRHLLDVVEENRFIGRIATKKDAVTLLKKLLTNV